MTPTFHYSVRIELHFSDDELRTLMRLSGLHYDARCKAIGRLGGFLYGMSIWQELRTDDSPHVLAFDQIDTLCKVLEQADFVDEARVVAPPLRSRLRDALEAIRCEHARLSQAQGA